MDRIDVDRQTRPSLIDLNTKCHKALSNKEHFDRSGQFPGPRIIAREGDRLVIKVENNIHHNVTLHWYPVLVM
ncbi:hypothetical protein ACFX2A_033437 [Malus domestica]